MRRTRPRRRGAGRGVKVRRSWTFTGNFMRRSAERLSCLFCRRQNAAGDCARRARKRHALGVPFLFCFLYNTCDMMMAQSMMGILNAMKVGMQVSRI